jgi:YidC/Oxa1 family membrane protein insertase
MPNTRILLWVALGLILFYNYQAWVHDYQAPATGLSAAGSAAASTSASDSVPDAVSSDAASSAASAPPPVQAAPATAPAPASGAIPSSAPGVATVPEGGATIRVKTDVLDLVINLKGGEIDQADLTQYPLHKDTPNIPVRLMSREPPDALYLMQTGLFGVDGKDAPTHSATWASAQTSYELMPGADELRVPLSWDDGQGLKITKTFLLKRGQYAIGLVYDIDNGGAAPRKLEPYSQIVRHWEHPSRSYFNVETYSFKGPAVYEGNKFRELDVEKADDGKFTATVTNGWLASLQHQFVSAVVPPPDQAYRYGLKVVDKQFVLSASGPATDIPAGGKAQMRETLFVGPKLQAQLVKAGPNLERTVDFGSLTVVAQPLFSALNWVHGIVGNWGWSIIIVTALIKLLFYPLSQASGRSMAKMRTVAPRMKQIQETFKDDREKLGRAMMELYKKEKINPLAGCLPMVVQIPVFISFYRVLIESVEMRQAPFMLWVNDLSSRDPYFILPIIMGGAMYGQFRLNPPQGDPTQQKIMQFMPLIMTASMMWFPVGLVLYWLTNTLLTILQQWRINKVVEKASKPRD